LSAESTAHADPTHPIAGTVTRLRGIPALVAAPVVTLCAVSTALLAEGVREHGDLSTQDPSVTAWFVHARTPLLNATAQVVTMVGSEPAIGILTLLVVTWLIVSKRAWNSAAVVAVSMAVSAVLIKGLKLLMERPRPPAPDVLGPLDSSFAFPSGHTLYSTVFFGLVAGLLLARTQVRTQRVLIVLGWVVASAVVGVSRLYLGYHWLTDVVASWTLAVAVLACAAAASAALRKHPLPVPPALRREPGLDGPPRVGAGS
jgi:undecaprenyl-diphosphatase